MGSLKVADLGTITAPQLEFRFTLNNQCSLVACLIGFWMLDCSLNKALIRTNCYISIPDCEIILWINWFIKVTSPTCWRPNMEAEYRLLKGCFIYLCTWLCHLLQDIDYNGAESINFCAIYDLETLDLAKKFKIILFDLARWLFCENITNPVLKVERY